jgi:3-carboxy-cis,cis-muconate cycloisomerase
MNQRLGQRDPSGLLDSRILGGVFSSARMRAIFTDQAMLRAWLDAEVALVRAQEELDIVPVGTADAISLAALTADFDLEAIGAEIMRTAHPLVPVIRELARVAGPAGHYVHLGATTQDITDTGLALQVRDALDLAAEQLDELIEIVAQLAERHRDLAMVGRTHAQHALPITLGLKFAVLLSELARHRDRIGELRPRVLVGELGGAVGSMAALGDQAFAVEERMMYHLGLGVAVGPWHTARDGLAEVTWTMSMVAATCGKIANEIRVLQRTEVAELEEPFAEGKVGSSTMPHKRNPMFSEFIISNAILARQLPAAMLAAMLQEHERDMSMWGVEWTAVPEAFQLAGGLLERTAQLLRGLIVHPDNIHRNLHLLGDLILSEAAMMQLTVDLGKTEAHDVVYRASMEAWSTGRPLLDLLLEDDDVIASSVDRDQLERVMVPELYIGRSAELVDRAIARVRTGGNA